MTSRGLRLLAYGRVSDVRGRSGESFISPEDQMQKCRSYAATYEHTIVEEGLDLDVSGGTMTRPVLDRFLEQIRGGKANGLIVAKLDRFSRSSRGALNALAEIEAAGGVLISVQEQIDSTTAAGRFVRSIFLATAEWERERIGENWATAKKEAVRRGIHISRHVPPGYRKTKNGVFEPHPKHSQTIAKAFEMAASGAAPSDIARYLTERELPSGNTQSPQWRSTHLKRLLSNRVYLGEARASDSIVNPDAHKPLVDEATFLRAQRTSTPRPLDRSKPLLAAIARCASCRYAMRFQASGGRSAKVYRCARNQNSPAVCPRPCTITASRLEDIVLDAYLERVFARQDEEPQKDDRAALEALENAKRTVSEVEALRSELRPAAYAQALNAALGELEEAENAVSRHPLASTDELLPGLQEAIAGALAGERAVDALSADGVTLLRSALSKEIQAVFVRPPARRSKALPISDRVKVVWADEELLDLPSRGRLKTLEPFTWPS